MLFFISLTVEGALAGALYALIALAFVVVYKASRVINFAIGEWLMLGALVVATAVHALGLAGAIAIAIVGMCALAWLFNTLVLQHLVGRPLISALMVTLGVGALIRGLAPLTLGGFAGSYPLPIPSGRLVLNDLGVPADKL